MFDFSKKLEPVVIQLNSETKRQLKTIFQSQPYKEKKSKKKITNHNETIYLDSIISLPDEPIQEIPKIKNFHTKQEKNESNNISLNPTKVSVVDIISKAINKKLSNEKQEINVNLNINHNYYNTNYNYVLSDNIAMGRIVNPQETRERFSQILKIDKKERNSESIYEITETSQTRTSIYKKRNSYLKNENFQYIPCINCGNWVHLDEVEKHSNTCVEVKEEIILTESSPYPYKSIDYKLNKLLEHLNNLKNSENKTNEEFLNDKHIVVSLSHYVSDTLEIVKICNKSLIDLKKILINIDVKINIRNIYINFRHFPSARNLWLYQF
jgi:hypothetical protein